jgi:hypothetical protein
VALGIVCSSFYAISLALRSLTLSRQAAYEYVFNGVVSGNETLFREVMLAPIIACLRRHGAQARLFVYGENQRKTYNLPIKLRAGKVSRSILSIKILGQ